MKYKYHLKNLECANCANKIECYLKNDINLNNVSVNFSKLTLTLDSNLEGNVKTYVMKKINEVEPNVKVLELNEQINNKKDITIYSMRVLIGIIVSLIGVFTNFGIVSVVFILSGYIILLFRVFFNAIKLLFKTKTINENLLITISCVGAYFTNNIHEGLMVIVLYEIGKILEKIAISNSRKSIAELMDIKPNYANIKTNEQITRVNPENVKVGDIIVVKNGERIPLDGIVVKGNTELDTSALTGESKLSFVQAGDRVLSGTINKDTIIEVKVDSKYEDSTVSKILELVENASNRKAKTETFVAKAAKIYTPTVLILAILAVILFPIIFKLTFEESIYRALTFLVISCPCAIAISVPLSYFSGIGACSKQGILVKGSNFLDVLCKIKTIIFDKTGTITTGSFSDYELNIIDNSYTKNEISSYYIKGEVFSNHPIANSIVRIFNKKVKTDDVINFKEHPGKGISYEIDTKKIKIGSGSFCKVGNKDKSIYLSINNKVVAKIDLVDGIKENAKEVIQNLNSMGINTIMFTGDNKDTALKIAKSVLINEVEYELLPEDKYKLLEQKIGKTTNQIAFAGDGINDAPALALADVGISMGGIGSASAIEASDIVIMNDDLSKIKDSILIAKKTNKIIRQNLIFALGTKVLVLILGTLGVTSMWQAVFADTGVTLIAILNTTRILRKK